MVQTEHSIKVANEIYKAIANKNITDIQVLQVGNLTTLADVFIIATAPNTRMVAALCDEVEEKLRLKGYNAISKEGYNTARWILLDYQGVIVHIFHKEESEFYRLDRLWNDAKILDLGIK